MAIVTDGSAILGMGNLGPYPAIPVMEGIALLYREFAGIDAIPTNPPSTTYLPDRPRVSLRPAVLPWRMNSAISGSRCCTVISTQQRW